MLDNCTLVYYNTSKMNHSKMEKEDDVMRELNPSVEFANKTNLAYSAFCKPLCQKLHLPQTAFDILMFLANNPDYKTARDIVEVRHIKANLVSINVDKLVQEGLLERRPVETDRRKTELVCTEKAAPIIEKGHEMQDKFIGRLIDGLNEEQLGAFFDTIDVMSKNLDKILEDEA